MSDEINIETVKLSKVLGTASVNIGGATAFSGYSEEVKRQVAVTAALEIIKEKSTNIVGDMNNLSDYADSIIEAMGRTE
jgi:hypothetical protein